jgi:hypothetical protein
MSSGEPWPNLAVQVAAGTGPGERFSGAGILAWLPLAVLPTLVLSVHAFLRAWLFMWLAPGLCHFSRT